MCQRGRQFQFMDNGNAGRRVIYLRARVYTKKFSSNTLRKHVRVPPIGIFPHNRVYTEKMIFQIHFFAISGVQTEDFSAYTLFPLQNRERGRILRISGVLRNNYFLYTPRLPELWSNSAARARLCLEFRNSPQIVKYI